MTWGLVQEKVWPTFKAVFISIAILWGLTTLSDLGSNTKSMSVGMNGVKSQYVGLHLSIGKLLKTLDNTNSQVELQNIILRKNHVALVKFLEGQQKQIDGLIEFLVKTQPEHKAILQSYTGRTLEVR